MIRADRNFAGAEPSLDLKGTDTVVKKKRDRITASSHGGRVGTYDVLERWPKAKDCRRASETCDGFVPFRDSGY